MRKHSGGVAGDATNRLATSMGLNDTLPPLAQSGDIGSTVVVNQTRCPELKWQINTDAFPSATAPPSHHIYALHILAGDTPFDGHGVRPDQTFHARVHLQISRWVILHVITPNC